MFPARAGMSPNGGVILERIEGVPRASGDEPNTIGEISNPGSCSPRERG